MKDNTSSENEKRDIREYISFFSHFYHFLGYTLRKPKIELEKSMFIVSIDVDVGNRELGVINKGKNDLNVHHHLSEYRIGEIEEFALPLFLDTFDNFQMPVTFAVRGQLVEIDNSSLELLIKSNIKHDIGAHGYYHKEFTSLTQNEAETELKLISTGMKKFDIIPKTFIFPRNKVSHLDLLAKYGYKCYRSAGKFRNDCMYIEQKGELFDIHPSLYLDKSKNFMFVKKIIDVAATKRLPFHIWFHLWNFGTTRKSIQRNLKLLIPLLEYAKKKEKKEELTFETMLSAAEKIEQFDL